MIVALHRTSAVELNSPAIWRRWAAGVIGTTGVCGHLWFGERWCDCRCQALWLIV